MSNTNEHLLLIEPFYGGSHKQLIDLLCQELPGCTTVTLPAKKWHWRARTSALYLSQVIPHSDQFRVLFCSSVLNLSELIALRPDLAPLKKIVYFHENQLVYPVRKQQDRDFQYGYSQILTALVADKVVFNSKYNQTSFLQSIGTYLKLIPDHRPRGLAEQIEPKCQVLYFPIQYPSMNERYYECEKKEAPSVGSSGPEEECVEMEMVDAECQESKRQKLNTAQVSQSSEDNSSSNVLSSDGVTVPGSLSEKVDGRETSDPDPIVDPSTLHIVWPHRWEHDKNPEEFFNLLYELKREQVSFKISILGETFTDVPSVFTEAKEKLAEYIVNWGYQDSKEAYYKILAEADVVISTAIHEFFGVAMLEATHLGCYPMCPNRLVYPEIFPKECVYNTQRQMYKKLKYFCQNIGALRRRKKIINTDIYSWAHLAPAYMELLSAEADQDNGSEK